MTNLDDEQFKHYLQQFRPASPDVLQIKKRAPTTYNPVWLATGALAAAILVGVGFLLSYRVLTDRVHRHESDAASASIEESTDVARFTLGHANALLAGAPSFKAAANQMAFKPRASQLSEHKQSALTVLGEEKIKL